MKLNRNLPFGTISPGWKGASYQQVGADGVSHFFNGQGFEVDIATGKVIEEPEPAAAGDDKDAAGPGNNADDIRELLNEKNDITHIQLAVRAAALLGGKELPIKKADIVRDLENRLGQIEEQNPEESAPALVKTDPGEVALGPWGRGEEEYLVGDVFRAIKERYSTVVHSKHEAVEALIREGVISEDQARDTNDVTAFEPTSAPEPEPDPRQVPDMIPEGDNGLGG